MIRRFFRAIRRVLLVLCTVLALVAAAAWVYGLRIEPWLYISEQWGGATGERFWFFAGMINGGPWELVFKDEEGPEPSVPYQWDIAADWPVFDYWLEWNPWGTFWTVAVWNHGRMAVVEHGSPVVLGRGFSLTVPASFPPVLFGAWPFLALVRFGFGRWRRHRRRARGLCIRCGYNLTGLTSSRCPECGTAFGPVSETANHECEQASG